MWQWQSITVHATATACQAQSSHRHDGQPPSPEYGSTEPSGVAEAEAVAWHEFV